MIELKEAVQRSFDALKEMAIVPPSVEVELEEAELEDGGDFWVVTFSYPDPHPGIDTEGAGPSLRALLNKTRAYKAIRLLSKDGSVRGIKSIHV
jgi:DNA topoisomerase VI subunit B